jgi:phospholipid:diacylglycerol acyltransferase
MLLDRKCWQAAVMLDTKTGMTLHRENKNLIAIGLDPPGFKLRAASGFEAADFFVAGINIPMTSQLTSRF